jgi:hypothetical protein
MVVKRIIRNRVLDSSSPQYHGPLVNEWTNRDQLKTYLSLRRLYDLPGDNVRPFAYRLPLYRRLQRFFQRNRQFVRKMYGQIKHHQLSKLTKSLTQTNDKKRRRMKNLALYLENNASGYLIMNRFFPAIKELRILIRNKKLLVNDQPCDQYTKRLSRHDVVHLDEYRRQNGQVMLNYKWRKQLFHKLYEMRYTAGGHSIALYRTNMFRDPQLTGGLIFDPEGGEKKISPMAAHLAVVFQHWNGYVKHRYSADPQAHLDNKLFWKSPFFHDQPEVLSAKLQAQEQKKLVKQQDSSDA